MAFIYEFMEFLKKYQVMGLAVAFIMAGAASKLVTAFVNDVVMPIIAVLVPGGDWRAFVLDVGPIKLLLGDLVGAIIDFAIIAAVIFLMVKFVMKEDATIKR